MESKYRVLVTSTSFGKADPLPLQRLRECGCDVIENPYGRPLKEDELTALLADVDGVIAGLDEYTERVIKSATRLKVISRYGVGVDKVDLKAAEAHGVRVTTTPGVNTQAVADLTMALMLAVARKVPKADASAKEGKWEKIFGHSLYQKKLGIVGLGQISKAVAKRAQGFDMEVSIFTQYPDASFAETRGIRYAAFNEILEQSDFLSLNCSMTPDRTGMIGYEQLRKMKPTSYLINTARGALIKEDDLYRALRDGIIAGAALDTYVQEPPKESPLLTLENIVTTPHIGSYTYETVLEMGLMSVENLIKALEGGEI
ncbi:MAG: hydroxyacid dehydrogenase [Proteobacteria bacterium]|nr:hydroxyacid dehydrogenase [Pseudomonadota bacterium]NIS72558.1 hydroxyacid dehydrogenase [Pseudomonadota bacterium]